VAVTQGMAGQPVTWSASPNVGTISSSGLYTAPSTVATAQTVMLTATSTTNPALSATALVFLTPPISVSVNPTNVALNQGQTQQFTATVQNTTNPAVSWSISPNVGTISTTGLYVAPATITASQTVTVTATSVANSSVYQSATVNLVPPVAVFMTPTIVALNAGQIQQFTATVQGSTNQGVNWQLSPSTGAGTISASGLYTAPATVASAQVVTLTATSQGYPTLSVTSTINLTTTTLTPPSGLALYWSFDSTDVSGTQVTDLSGSGNTGTISGSPTSVPGKVNQALNFNGTNSSVSAAPNLNMAFANNVTLAAWINTTNTSRLEAIISKFNASGSGSGYIFRTDQNGHLEVMVGANDIAAYPNIAVDTATINDGNWHYVVAVITIGQTVQFYVDGNLSSSTAISSVANGDGNSNLLVGANSYLPYGNYFTGAIDEVRVYNQALTASQLSVVYQLSGGPPPPVSVSVSPASVLLTQGQTQQFSATVQSLANQGVTWSINPSIGTISAAGLYTPPTSISSQTITVTATSVAQTTQFGTATINLAGSIVSFVGSDTTTQGNWQGVYGADGYSIANSVQSLPSYASTFAPQNQSNYTWASSTTDVRALQLPSSGRIASTWYSNPGFNLNVNFTDSNAHKLALYALDWDSGGRSETIQIRDASSNAVLDSRTISGFSGGVYLVWNITGHVTVSVTLSSGANAVIGGAFFGGATSVNQSTPTITWPTPSPITYGTQLGNSQLDATASYNGSPLPGTLVYSPAAGGVPTVGNQTLSVTFTPNDTFDYKTVTSTVTLAVNQATPTVNWTTPGSIAYGTALSSGQLNATATANGLSVPGTFAYTPAAGTMLGAGNHSLSVTFTPTDGVDYGAGTANTTITVIQGTPTITWPTPSPITTTTALSSTQLNATATLNGASVPGSFLYSPPAGTLLSAGNQVLSVTFTPTDNVDLQSATAAVTVVVNQAVVGNQATFFASDSTTKGNWPGVYGGDGYSIANSTQSIPAYASFTPQSVILYTWAASTTDTRALELSGGSGRIASTWYNYPSFSFDVNFTDGNSHRLALYALDWDNGGRAETIQILDGTTGALLDTRNASGFSGGLYLIWNMAGHVKINVTLTSGANAVISGVFFGTGAADPATPTLTWSTPAPITYGTALSGTQLDATASYNGSTLPGTFAYTPAAGSLPTAGNKVLSVTFTPTDTVDYQTATAAVTLTVNQATPAISWPTPASITYGTALSGTQLDATASFNGATVAGAFVYSPVAGTILGAGSQTLSVTFTPTDTVDYKTVTSSATLTVNQASPTINWPSPAPITSGTALGNAQLDAAATFNGSSVPGNFVYSPGAGTILSVGSQTLSVTFTPTDTTDYKTATGTTSLTVNAATQSTPLISWSTPAAIAYGTALSGTQLNATASFNGSSVAGTFAYSPAAGTVLTAGSKTLSVTFTPTDTTDFSTASSSVTLTVNQATALISWSTPAAITYGTALSGTQLNATASFNGSSVAGSFVYSPAAGAVPTAGSKTLSVTFTPTDTTDFSTAGSSVILTVNQAAPAIAWATPTAITYGTALSSTQLNATESFNGSSVAGSFVYSPAVGAVPAAGNQNLSVTFTPTDTTDYKTVTGSVSLTVNQATPAINWATPSPITYGTALSSTQLNATASFNGSSVAGTFVYSPAAGAVLSAGSQNLSVTFTPTDGIDFKSATASVTLVVNTSSSGSPTVTFVVSDGSTQGNWQGSYGADGYSLANSTQSLPSYASFTPTGQSNYTWTTTTSDPRALQAASGSSRIASAWYGSAFSFDVNFTDGNSHLFAFYALDWDNGGRAETIQVLNASTNAVLDTRTISNFNNGLYLVWNISGHVKITVSLLSGTNAVLNGAFFGGNGAVSVAVNPQSVNLIANQSQSFTATVTGSTNQNVTWSVSPNVGTITSTGASTATYTAPSSIASAQTVTVTATSAAAPKSGSASVSLSTGTSAANFTGFDNTTEGSWIGVYGKDGYSLANSSQQSIPAYAVFSVQNAQLFTWSASTTDPRALQNASGSGRFAPTWYGTSSFYFDVNVSDGNTHQIELYALDWDSAGRAETIQVLDAATNTVLDTRTISNFSNGLYLLWSISGHVKIQVSLLSGPNDVSSALFFK